jgi:hypothetical protein
MTGILGKLINRNPDLLGGVKNRLIMYAKTELFNINRQIEAMEENPEKYMRVIGHYYEWRIQINNDVEFIKKMKV